MIKHIKATVDRAGEERAPLRVRPRLRWRNLGRKHIIIIYFALRCEYSSGALFLYTSPDQIVCCVVYEDDFVSFNVGLIVSVGPLIDSIEASNLTRVHILDEDDIFGSHISTVIDTWTYVIRVLLIEMADRHRNIFTGEQLQPLKCYLVIRPSCDTRPSSIGNFIR
ncbi:hypothetical protein H6P81_008264 [Aristolochia fimbriata]|uniref:Uncharacterized protein n=1 Tax=Aristolochia fimbriata TaxID=158543 RepID=A0AAV7F2I6_ARIFI|nr:hypothetical protein H6P81_008264 [Aristolochia fimbriata]